MNISKEFGKDRIKIKEKRVNRGSKHLRRVSQSLFEAAAMKPSLIVGRSFEDDEFTREGKSRLRRTHKKGCQNSSSLTSATSFLGGFAGALGDTQSGEIFGHRGMNSDSFIEMVFRRSGLYGD